MLKNSGKSKNDSLKSKGVRKCFANSKSSKNSNSSNSSRESHKSKSWHAKLPLKRLKKSKLDLSRNVSEKKMLWDRNRNRLNKNKFVRTSYVKSQCVFRSSNVCKCSKSNKNRDGKKPSVSDMRRNKVKLSLLSKKKISLKKSIPKLCTRKFVSVRWPARSVTCKQSGKLKNSRTVRLKPPSWKEFTSKMSNANNRSDKLKKIATLATLPKSNWRNVCRQATSWPPTTRTCRWWTMITWRLLMRMQLITTCSTWLNLRSLKLTSAPSCMRFRIDPTLCLKSNRNSFKSKKLRWLKSQFKKSLPIRCNLLSNKSLKRLRSKSSQRSSIFQSL